MIVFYGDECGDHSLATTEAGTLKSGVSPYFVFAVVGIHDSSRMTLAASLAEVKRRHFGEDVYSRPWADSELKGRYLARVARSVNAGKSLTHPTAYEVLDTPKKVDALLRDLGLLFAKFRPIVFAVTIDKERVLMHPPASHKHPVGVAYAYIHQRVALGLEKLYAGESAIIVADQQADHEKIFRSGALNRVRDELTAGVRVKPDYDLVLDKPLWVDTDLSSSDREVIQLADIVAYSASKAMERGSAPTEPCFLWPSIYPCLAVHWTAGGVLGGGLSYYPKDARKPTI